MNRVARCGGALTLALFAGCPPAGNPEPPPRQRPPEAASYPPLPARFQRGMNFDHLGGFERALDADAATASLTALGELGVSHVAITPSFFQRRLGDTEFYWKRGRDAVDGDARAAIRLAHASGLQVLLKPHLWLEDRSDGAWRGRINPSDAAWPAWRRSYREVLLSYARLGREERVAGMVIGSELTDLAVGRPEFWRALAAELRPEFPGFLTYAANWDREFDRITWWDALDYVGVDAFWPLTDSPDEELTAAACAARLGAIRDALEAVSVRVGRPVLLTEVGYKSAAGAAHRPWEWHSDATYRVDLELQATVYDSLATVLGGAAGAEPPWLKGVYFWLWYADLGWGGPGNTDFTPRGKPAEGVVADWYRINR